MNNVVYIVCMVAAELFLIICGSFFSSTETAYTALSKISVRQMQKENTWRVRLVAKLHSNLDTLIATALIGTNFVTTLISSLGTAFSMKVLGPEYVTYGTAVISILVIIFMEIIPKTYAANKSRAVAKRSAPVISVIKFAIYPLVLIFSFLTKFIELIEKIMFRKKRPLITEDELKTLLDLGENEGTLEQDERKMLERIFEFSDLSVHDIMRHRSLVKYVDVNSTLEEVVHIFAESGFSRLPVYENEVENIIGVLHYKAVIFASGPITESKDFVRICMRPVEFVPETFSAVELLQRFKKDKSNFAVAVNEYGGMAGIVTMDDILREVFDRITDEYGQSEVSPETKITVVGTNEFLVPGDLKLDDLNSVLNFNLYSENFETLGGWLLERFGELPSIGSVYKNSGRLFIVEDQSSRRIQSVRIKLI